MPNRYSCSYPTCPTKLAYPGRRCAEHGGSKRPHHSNYTGSWPGIRAQQLATYPTCECGAKATEVDHLMPLTPMPGSSMPGTHDASNLVSRCHACHATKTARENAIRFGGRTHAR